ncbi:MAG TPA: hypothetical protein VNP92_21595 [Actinophytocola sp.]|nr:hypothetical protein [Actinophytocola sp.]
MRLTAQRLITAHAYPGREHDNPVPTFWIDLDLAGAALIGFDLGNCTVRTATFTSAAFIDPANFGSATFTEKAYFRFATSPGRRSSPEPPSPKTTQTLVRLLLPVAHPRR